MRIGILIIACLAAAPAVAQSWTRMPSVDAPTTAAGVRWPNGTGAVARCREGRYQLMFTLATPTAGETIDVILPLRPSDEAVPEPWRMNPQGNATFARLPVRTSEIWLRGRPLHLTLQGHEEQVLTPPDNAELLRTILADCGHRIDVSLPEQPAEITTPSWRTLPDSWIMSRYYPQAAALQGVNGDVTLHCVVTVEGMLEDCITLEERPANSGFGPAALALSRELSLNPVTEDGRPVGETTVRFSLPFRMDPRFDRD